MEIKNKLELYILAQGADAAPPLGTVLGNLGVNSINFCKEFNSVTEDLPNFLTLTVRISVFSNKSYKFSIEQLPLTPLLNLVAYERTRWIRGKSVVERCVALKNVLQIVRFMFPLLSIREGLPIILGTLKTMQLLVV